MKIVGRQLNSRMCAVCGLDNPFGLKAPFYNMEDRSVMTVFRFQEFHQSYPGRVHGGLIAAMLDEMGLRGLWAWQGGCEAEFGVTMKLECSYRKPVPYGVELVGRGIVTSENHRAFVVNAEIMDMRGVVLANGSVQYLRVPVAKIAAGADAALVHEEMPYLIEDGRTEIIRAEDGWRVL